ncbi:hypothetical protein EMPG_11718 [Blastomyces silverae]|uniref:Uncharacterized protein n=1 Tax=Blastomyces silverae TaxID=2060906 RepID=A0A0H1BQH3_9EURO|nr:hypothetical protein EMPG_11718 [Blastomyces silverae]
MRLITFSRGTNDMICLYYSQLSTEKLENNYVWLKSLVEQRWTEGNSRYSCHFSPFLSLKAEVLDHLLRAYQHLRAVLPELGSQESSPPKRLAEEPLSKEADDTKRLRTTAPKPSSSSALDILRNRSRIPSNDGAGDNLPPEA